MVMIDHLPPSLRGLMVAAFAAAYMSTIATQLNWGASYLVNDFYRRFLNGSDGAGPLCARIAAGDCADHARLGRGDVLHGFDRRRMEAADRDGRGHGHPFCLLRWYWWRINAWSEVSAMISAFVVSVSMQKVFGFDSARPVDEAWIMMITVAITTVVWLSVTFLTRRSRTRRWWLSIAGLRLQ